MLDLFVLVVVVGNLFLLHLVVLLDFFVLVVVIGDLLLLVKLVLDDKVHDELLLLSSWIFLS